MALAQVENLTNARAAAGLDLSAPAAELAPDDLRNLEATARFFDVSLPTLRAWIGDGCPVYEKGGNGVAFKLSLRSVAAWRRGLREEEERQAEARAASDEQLRLELFGGASLADQAAGGGPLSPKQRQEAIAAELAATKLAQMRRELVSAEGVALAIAQVLQQVSARIRAVPEQLQARLGLDEAGLAAAIDVVDGALEEIAETLEHLEAAQEPGELA